MFRLLARRAASAVRLIFAFQCVSSRKYASSGSSIAIVSGAFARRARRASRSRNSSDVTVVARTTSRPTNAPRTATAAGVTPGIRSAWPSVSGRTCDRRWTTSRDRPGRGRRESRAGSAGARPSAHARSRSPGAAGIPRTSRRSRRWRRRTQRPPASSSNRWQPRLRRADPPGALRADAAAGWPATRSPVGDRTMRRVERPRDSARTGRCRAENRSHRSSSTRPASRPRGVSRRSALSMRSSSRCSARDVNMRYGSRQPLVMRSSTRMPM